MPAIGLTCLDHCHPDSKTARPDRAAIECRAFSGGPCRQRRVGCRSRSRTGPWQFQPCAPPASAPPRRAGRTQRFGQCARARNGCRPPDVPTVVTRMANPIGAGSAHAAHDRYDLPVCRYAGTRRDLHPRNRGGPHDADALSAPSLWTRAPRRRGRTGEPGGRRATARPGPHNEEDPCRRDTTLAAERCRTASTLGPLPTESRVFSCRRDRRRRPDAFIERRDMFFLATADETADLPAPTRVASRASCG